MVKDKRTGEEKFADEVQKGMTAEQWEEAYIKLQAKMTEREKLAKEVVKILMKMF